MKITWYGHAAYKVEIKDASILIDPFLTGNPSFPEGVSVEDVSKGVTHILLTHGHNDHVGDSIAILKETGAQLTADADLIDWASRQGVENLNPMNSGGTVDVGPFKVSMTRAYHSSGYTTENGKIYQGDPHGVVITAPDEKVLYHMGDTDLFSDMSLINELYAPKIGIVPIGDRFTMGARAAAIACTRFLDFDTILPCHFGTFPLLDQTPDAFLSELGNQAGRVKLPEPGVTFEV